MDSLTSELSSILLLIAIGIVIGTALTKILSKGSRNTELIQKLEATELRFSNYRQEVAKHFQQTATLVNHLTESYREVHKHLSTGAQTLVTKESLDTVEVVPFKPFEKEDSNKNNESL